RYADLRYAKLRDADLRDADLRYADLRDADLQGADLQGVILDFSVFPLWCGSFNMKVDNRLVYQLIAHIHRLDTSGCGKDVKKILEVTNKWRNQFCRYRGDVEAIKK
ncbi:pentapeptide repeat-containing protein, partial [Patescibacteria group bacterium]|nr:pentapeptide repeat-containing protein [Patescibacteria group bacterium]